MCYIGSDGADAARRLVSFVLSVLFVLYVANCISKYRLRLTSISTAEEPQDGFYYPPVKICVNNTRRSLDPEQVSLLAPEVTVASHDVVDRDALFWCASNMRRYCSSELLKLRFPHRSG